MNQPIHNDYWLSRFERVPHQCPGATPCRLVNLGGFTFPEHMPVTHHGSRSGFSVVISRFFESLKAKIQAYQRKNDVPTKVCVQPPCIISGVGRLGKEKGRKHYHVILLLEQRYLVLARDFTVPSSLATLIQLAWCSALHLEPWQGNGLVHFFQADAFSVKPVSSDARPSSR